MNTIRDATIKKIHDEKAETQTRIQKRESRKYLLQSKIHARLNSKYSRRRQKLRAGSIFKTNEKIARLQEGKNPATVFQRVGSL
jgi:hypothetical protein